MTKRKRVNDQPGQHDLAALRVKLRHHLIVLPGKCWHRTGLPGPRFSCEIGPQSVAGWVDILCPWVV